MFFTIFPTLNGPTGTSFRKYRIIHAGYRFEYAVQKNRPSGHFPHFLTVCLSVSVMIYMSSPKVNVKLLINCVIC